MRAQNYAPLYNQVNPFLSWGQLAYAAKIPTEHETVLIIGNQVSFAFLRSYGPALRAAGNRVIYFGQFKNKEEIYCQDIN